jgi:organic radical activating enzyme
VKADEAYVSEIFSSAQGEGPHVGRRQIFVRLAGCTRRCVYCDTPRGLAARPAQAFVETEAGTGNREARPNPLSAGAVAQAVQTLHTFPHHAAAITGGEPLLWDAFLLDLLPRLRQAGLRTFLETNADLPDALARVLPDVDIVSADLKLPSATTEPLDWEKAGDFLSAASTRELIVKIVVTMDIDDAEIDRAFALIRARGSGAVTVLQPVTPVPGGPASPPGTRLLALQARGLGLLDVRVIPQTHKTARLP